MSNCPPKRYVLTLELVLCLSLLGILLISANIYYRAIRFQRFMEPILAVSRPKINFMKHIKRLLYEEFGTSRISGVSFTADSILVDVSIFKTIPHYGEVFGPKILGKLGKIFLSILKDPDIMLYVDIILVNREIPLGADAELNKNKKDMMLRNARQILRALYDGTPELEKKFGKFFTATAIPSPVSRNRTNKAEFRFIPTERLHIDIINEFGKYF